MSEPKSPKLMPCPFCGTDEHLKVAVETLIDKHEPVYVMYVTCENKDCLIDGPYGTSKGTNDARVVMQTAIERWNTRRPTTP